MNQYHQVLKKVLEEGEVIFEPRTQTYTLGISGCQSEYDLREGFPLVTTKNVPPRLPFEELFWKLRGERNVKGLVDRGVHIWTANAFDRYLRESDLERRFPKHSERWNRKFEEYKRKIKDESDFAEQAGDLGPVYGYQWRHWKKGDGEVDQLEGILNGIKTNPGSRYHILNAWNPGELKDMALGPCPFWHQFIVYGNNLDLHMVQRSCDTYLGVPFNIAQDALLAHIVAEETGLLPRKFIHTMINTHLYLGISPRADFWIDSKSVGEFRKRVLDIQQREKYLELRDWYLGVAPRESEGNERKDHIPLVLEQLSKEPRNLPRVALQNIPLFEAIQKPVADVVSVDGYEPHRWDSKAEMAA